MKVLSLFDGMGCGALALNSAGIDIESYDAFETDPYTTKVAMHNFPFIKQHGDVFKGDFTQFAGVDLLCGGSPCTYWSIAQKGNRETEASGLGWELFLQYVRALHEAKPRYFVYENNYSMSPAIRESITKAFGFEPVCINSNLVSAQNRKRLYWVGQLNSNGTYSRVNVEQPEDKMIFLSDILDSGRSIFNSEKAKTLCSHYAKLEVKTWYKRVYNENPNKQQHDFIAEPVGVGFRNRREEDGKLYRRYESHNDPKANALTTVQTDSMVAIPHLTNESSADTYEVLNGLITIKGKQYKISIPDGCYIIRKFTVNECKRLQTVPEWYDMSVISKTRAYKCLGNGWTVDVIAHIFTHIKREDEKLGT